MLMAEQIAECQKAAIKSLLHLLQDKLGMLEELSANETGQYDKLQKSFADGLDALVLLATERAEIADCLDAYPSLEIIHGKSLGMQTSYERVDTIFSARGPGQEQFVVDFVSAFSQIGTLYMAQACDDLRAQLIDVLVLQSVEA
jgi:hypothetical protein